MGRSTDRRVRVGLWARMLVASTILLASLLILLALEFLLVLLIASLVYGVTVGAIVAVLEPVPLVALVVAFVCYLGLLFVGYHAFRVAHSEDLAYELPVVASEIGATVESLRRGATLPRAVAAIGGVLGLFAGSLLLANATRIELYFLFLPALVSLVVVGSHAVHTVREELSGDVAVLRTIDETVHLSDDLERDPELETIRRRLERLATQAGVPTPEVRIAVTRTPTAMTVGYRPGSSTIVLTRGLVKELDDRELAAVMAHELAHVANRDAAIMSAMSIPAAKAEAFFDRYDGAGHLGFLVLFLQGVSRWCVIAVARYREYAADDGAVAITADPAGLASALETLDRSVARRPASDLRHQRSAAAFSIVPPPWEERRFLDRARQFVVRRLFGTHPPTARRIERLRARV